MLSQKSTTDIDIQHIIGWILRLGVIISMFVVFAGGCLYLYRHGTEVLQYSQFKGVPDFVHTPLGIWHGILTLRGRAIIQAGIILLIATPVIRIIFSAIGFALEKDWLYTGLTLLVLAIIIGSALTGHAG
ncbi:DUF1634 domain-containing protein [Mucilaginibacter sp. PAMB04274]|uniref:DUF1634 domain-containing protein n=1 Tax=Mucilaginibacter sp. PAMB04274 TaxID=3138568 RepID=UPI0031F65EF3